MTSISRNVIASITGQGWAAAIQLLFVPIYVRLLGIEGYGLIGFYALIQGLLQVLDFGLSQGISRELARYSVLPNGLERASDLVRTLEIGYWMVGILAGLGLYLLSPLLAEKWLSSNTIPVRTTESALHAMAFLFTLQWPVSFYQSGFMGLQKHVQLNVLRIAGTTVTAVGSVVALLIVAKSVVVLLAWQIIISAIYVFLLVFILWQHLGTSNYSPKIGVKPLAASSRFLLGMSGVSITGIILGQLDKLVLSKLLSLEQFGYYSLAWVASNGLNLIVLPLYNAIFPRLSALVASNDEPSLKHLYHVGSQVTAFLVLPLAALLIFFPYETLWVWTQNAVTAGNAQYALRFLAIGTSLNALMYAAYTLQLSHGWTSIGLKINLFFIATIPVLVYVLATRYGTAGAAASWMTFNVIYMAIGVPLTHRKLLQKEGLRWLIDDVGKPVVSLLVVASMGRWLFRGSADRLTTLGELAAVFLACFFAVFFAASEVRRWTFARIEAMKFLGVVLAASTMMTGLAHAHCH